MSSACPLLLLIWGCWALPLPSSVTLVWSVLDNGQNQVNLMCLVKSRPDAIITVWISNVNETRERTSDGIQNTVPASFTQQYVFSSRSDQYPVLVLPFYGGPSSLFSTDNSVLHISISLSNTRLPIITTSTSLNMPLHSMATSLSSKKEVNDLMSSPSLRSGFFLQPAFTENNKADSLTSDSQQALSIYFGQPVLTGNLHNFAHLSLPIDSFQLWNSAASCFLAEADSVDINDIILPGEMSHSLCYDKDFSMTLALRMKQDFLFVLTIRIVVFKLFIFNLLVTWIAILQTCRPLLIK